MKLGVFDSGIGGEAVAAALRRNFPLAQIDTLNDRAHMPYGDRSQEEVCYLTETAITPFINGSYDIIILACNTATMLTIDYLRKKYPSQKFIGIEPMIKPAAVISRTKAITVCATPATLASRHYSELIEQYGANLDILEPDCSKWAYLIENNKINRSHIQQVIEACHQHRSDVIVLGCTHYHWIKELIIEMAGEEMTVLEPSEAIGQRVRELLQK